MVFLENETVRQCVTMWTHARAFVATIYCIIFCIPYAIGALFKRILAWEGDTSKTWFLD